MLTVQQRYRRTDIRTDDLYDSNTALALRAARGKKVKIHKRNVSFSIYLLQLFAVPSLPTLTANGLAHMHLQQFTVPIRAGLEVSV